MSKHIGTIKEAFDLDNGTMLVMEWYREDLKLELGSPIQLLKPNGDAIATKIVAIAMNMDIMIEKAYPKTTIPPGTRIFL